MEAQFNGKNPFRKIAPTRLMMHSFPTMINS